MMQLINNIHFSAYFNCESSYLYDSHRINSTIFATTRTIFTSAMGFSNAIIIWLSLLLIFTLSCSFLVTALDTITISQSMREPKILSSNNNKFPLGFFTPENSTNHNVGICYMSKSAIVWVANINQPLKDSSGATITISENGNLVILDAHEKVIWSTDVSFSDAAASNSNNTSNTAIPTLKISKNVRTSEEVRISSWKSISDPSYGSFSLGLETGYVTELFIWNGILPFWRSGPWNDHVFIGTPNIMSLFWDGVSLEEKDETFYYSYDYANKSLLRIYVLNPQGKVERRHWDYGNKEWKLKGIVQDSECDLYGICGPFGICNSQSSPICSCLKGFEPKNKEEWSKKNWTNGCLRKETLQCEMEKKKWI
jgi:hypothetical protein